MPGAADIKHVFTLDLPSLTGHMPDTEALERHALIQKLQPRLVAQTGRVLSGLFSRAERIVPDGHRAEQDQYRSQCFNHGRMVDDRQGEA